MFPTNGVATLKKNNNNISLPRVIFKTKALFDESFQIIIIPFIDLCKHKVTVTSSLPKLVVAPDSSESRNLLNSVALHQSSL